MALGPRLDLRTSQTLVISPQLQAAIKLLTLSNLELQAEIAAELERNPLLEMAEDGDGGPPDTTDEAPPPAADHDPADMDTQLAAEDHAHNGSDLDVDYVEERFHHDSVADSGRPAEPGEEFSFDSVAADDVTLAEHLERQAMGIAPALLPIVLHLISLIDEAGYLTEPCLLVAERLGVPEAQVDRALAIVQQFEPTGVGARNLAECIALQAKEADRYDPCMAALIDNLELVARGDLAQLRRLCDVDAEDLADMLRELRGYNPKPGLAWGGGRTVPVVPDIFVRRSPRGGFTVELNSGTLPRLIVNRQYQARIAAHSVGKAPARGKPERQFLDSCVSQAQWLMKALDQRAGTIMKVAIALVEEQQAFFEKGVAHLKPLTLRQIADAIEMHESTVSRVTSNKYLACDRGVFELKYFFTSAIQAADGGDAVSAEAVKSAIRALIGGEGDRILSDDTLVDLLNARGFDIARRTVAKYREAMGIGSSVQRRRARALAGA